MSYSIIAQIKKKKNDSFATIVIRGYYNRKAVVLKSLGIKIDPENWDPHRRTVKNLSPNASLINTKIQTEIIAIQKNLLEKELVGIEINNRVIRDSVKGLSEQDFFEYVQQKIAEQYNNKGTIRYLHGQLNKVKNFKSTLRFTDINYAFLHAYKAYMQNELNNSDNTIWSSLKFLNTFCNKALKEGIIQKNPFASFDRGKYKDPPKPYFTVQEIESIEKFSKSCTNHTIKAVSIRLLLMIYSGMRYIDAMRFDPDKNFIGGRFVMDYQKFNSSVDFKASKKLKNVIQEVKEYPLSITLETINKYLKVIAAVCNIEHKKVSTHIGRHTMGYLLSELNVPIEKAQKILGHKDIRSTKIYYHITKNQIDREVEKIDHLKINPEVETTGR